MEVKFEFASSAYLDAAREVGGCSRTEDVVPEGLRFTYGNVTKATFYLARATGSWKGHHIAALDAISGMAQAVGRVALTVLATIVGLVPLACISLGKDYLQIGAFFALREAQSAYGFAALLFNQEYGSYHVEEAQFQKTCYFSYLQAILIEDANKLGVPIKEQDQPHYNYTVLGLDPFATEDEIKEAYHSLALLYHPDKNPGDQQAEEQFKIIGAAYRALMNEW